MALIWSLQDFWKIYEDPDRIVVGTDLISWSFRHVTRYQRIINRSIKAVIWKFLICAESLKKDPGSEFALRLEPEPQILVMGSKIVCFLSLSQLFYR